MNTTEELIAKAQAGQMEAKETLIAQNTGLIWSIARRFIGRGAELDDLYQLGCLGFLKAIDGFDLAFGTQFSTYAVPKISGEIRRFLRDDGAIKVSRSIKEQAAQIKNARQILLQRQGREPTIGQISEITGIAPEEIATAEAAVASVESIQQENGEGGLALEDVLSNEDGEEKLLEHILLRHSLNRLPDREQMLISLRYFHGLTQEQTAKILQVSQVQVSRIEKKAINRLRDLMY